MKSKAFAISVLVNIALAKQTLAKLARESPDELIYLRRVGDKQAADQWERSLTR